MRAATDAVGLITEVASGAATEPERGPAVGVALHPARRPGRLRRREPVRPGRGRTEVAARPSISGSGEPRGEQTAGSDAEAVTNHTDPAPSCRSASSARSRSPGAAARRPRRPQGSVAGGPPAIDRGLIVSVDRLIDSLWGDHEVRAQRSRCAPRSRGCGSACARPGHRGRHRDPRPGLRLGRAA